MYDEEFDNEAKDWSEALEALYIKWGYVEIAVVISTWVVRNKTDEGIGSDGKEITYEGDTAKEALMKACKAEGIRF